MDKLVLVVFPTILATKIAIFDNRKPMLLTTIKHQPEVLEQFKKIIDQTEYRKNAIIDEITKANINLNDIHAVVGRGGLLKPVTGGVYSVNDKMIEDTKNPMGEHESNLGGIIAYEIARQIGPDIPALIVDPACVDEMDAEYKISGLPEIPRRSILHTLNQRTIARRFAREIGKQYEEINVIVAHIARGISVGAHKNGRIIDVNNGLIGDGPMSTERSGSLPTDGIVELCFSGKYSEVEILSKLRGKGGALAYLGTNDYTEIEQRISQGDTKAEIIYTAIASQISKEIGALSTSLKGKIDGILLTGSLAYSNVLINLISERIKHLGLIRIYPGDDYMQSLALHGYLVLDGEITPKEYV